MGRYSLLLLKMLLNPNQPLETVWGFRVTFNPIAFSLFLSVDHVVIVINVQIPCNSLDVCCSTRKY